MKIDWPALRERIDMIALGTAIFGEPRKRTGGRAWWLCPWHDDHDPSLAIDAKRFQCWSCKVGGDAAALVMKTQGLDFGRAVRWLADWSGLGLPLVRADGGRASWSVPVRGTAVAGRFASGPSPPPAKAPRRPPPGPRGLSRDEAWSLHDEAMHRLAGAEGRDERERLKRRGLTVATMGRARLGFAPRVVVPKKDGKGAWTARGVTIPWFDASGELVRLKLRQPAGRSLKYVELFDDGADHYAPFGPIVATRPLVIVEGEFEALLLGQLLEGFANVVTTGSASSAASAPLLASALACPGWFAAHDADEAGDRAAAEWAPRAVRVRPPRGKDWTESHQAGIDVRAWWAVEHLVPLYDHEERLAIREA